MLKKIKVIVIDDHDLIREGLNRIISFEEDLEILGEGKNGEETLELVESKKPEVVVLDINMPKKNGLEALKEIKEKDKNIKVIMLTVENDKKTIFFFSRSNRAVESLHKQITYKNKDLTIYVDGLYLLVCWNARKK